MALGRVRVLWVAGDVWPGAWRGFHLDYTPATRATRQGWVFTMPAVLAGAGTSSLVVLAVVAVGAMVLAVLFGQLTRPTSGSR